MARFRPSLLIGIVLLTLWGLFLSLCVVVYVRYGSSHQLAAAISQELNDRAGVHCSIGGASPSFFPVPHLRLEAIALDVPDGRVHIAEADIYLNWASLLRANFIPGRIVLTRPGVLLDLRAPAPVEDQSVAGRAQVFPGIAIPDELRGVRLIVKNGVAHLALDQGTVKAEEIQASFLIPASEGGAVTFEAGAVDFLAENGRAVHGKAVRVQAGGLESGDRALRLFRELSLQGTLNLPGILNDTRLALTLASDREAPRLGGSVSIRSELEARPPIPAHVDFEFEATEQTIAIRNAVVSLDDNVGRLDGTLDLGAWREPFDALLFPDAPPVKTQSALPALSGRAVVERLSLPRWFDFARSLPPGLEHALHDLKGELDFTLTPKTLTVPRLKAVLCGMPFSGSGGVPDFSKPEIRISAHTNSADANLVLPELVQKAPDALTWQGPPPVGGDDDDGSEGPDYDIHLTAKAIKAWKYSAGDFSIRITPTPKGTRLAIDAGSFYEGSLQSHVDIEDAITITSSLRDVSAAKPVALASGIEGIRGVLNAQSSLVGEDASFDHFLASLSGSIEGEFRQGSLGGTEASIPFDSLKFTFKPKGPGLKTKTLPPELPFEGTWQAVMRTPDWEASAQLNGAFVLDSSSLALKRVSDVPGTVQWAAKGIQATFRTQASFDLDKQSLYLAAGSGAVNGGSISGSVSGARLFDEPEWQGSVSLTTRGLRAVLQQNGMLPAHLPAKALQQLTLSGEWVSSGRSVALKNLKGKLGDTIFSGSAQRNLDLAPHWNVALALGNLNLSHYLPESKPGDKQTDWPTTLLDGLAARGQINLDSLTVSKLVQRSVRVPFTLERNTLTCSPVTFAPYNGQGEAALSVRGTPQGYQTRFRYAAKQADSALFCKEAGLDTIVGGTGAVSVDVSGLLRRGKDIPAALSGAWGITNTNGFMAERKKDGSLGTKTPFRSISASGAMENGVLKTANLELRSESMAAKGRGSIDLPRWTLNIRLNVSTKTFNNVPVTYTGSLDAPERSVNALNAVTGTLNKMGSGLFGLMEDILSAPFRLFQR